MIIRLQPFLPRHQNQSAGCDNDWASALRQGDPPATTAASLFTRQKPAPATGAAGDVGDCSGVAGG